MSVVKILLQVAFLASLQGTLCDKFTSVPVTVNTYENDSVLLPCYLDESETSYRVRWYRGSQVIADSEHEVQAARVLMFANFSLQIVGLTSEDTGEYTCDIIRPEPRGSMKQIHSIVVQSAPSVRTVPEEGFLEVRKGEYVDIGCEATGTPPPIISWRKNGEEIALLEHRHRIKFRAEHRLLAGVYECVAVNGVGDPVKASIRVVVHDAPVVTAERSFVHTAVGLRAALAAKLEFAVPPAKTAWYRDGRPVRTDDRVVIMVFDDIHQLIFRTVRKTDLGNYTFRAENPLGMADVSFKLTGIPNVASFKVDPGLNKATATSFTLIWEVDSYSTIIEYNLWLRPYYGRPAEPDGFVSEPPGNTWSKIVVPGDSREGPLHSAVYTVRGLTPSSVYEAIVTSRNRFGWSKPSSVLHFATDTGVGYAGPPTSDYVDITPVLEDEQSLNVSQAKIISHTTDKATHLRSSLTVICAMLVAAFIR